MFCDFCNFTKRRKNPMNRIFCMIVPMKKIIVVLSFVVMFCGTVGVGKAQTVLKLKTPLVYYTAGGSIGLLAAGHWATLNTKPYTIADLATFNRDNLNAIDRQATFQYNTQAIFFSDATAFTCAAVPAAMSLLPKIRKEFVTYNAVYAQCLLATMGQSMILKGFINKARPYVYNTNAPLDRRLSRDAGHSFPSMHTSVSAAACFFAATTYCLYYPESKYKVPVWIGAVILPALTGYLRNQSGRHFYSDIAGGYAIGAANGILFPLLFKQRK